MDTVGNLIDKLSIVNIRIWFAEDIKRNKGATDKQLADACRVTNVANSQRNDLIQEIDEMLNRMITTGELQKLYKQGATKMYGRDLADAAPAAPADTQPPAPSGPATT
jgi:hypothetical protein